VQIVGGRQEEDLEQAIAPKRCFFPTVAIRKSARGHKMNREGEGMNLYSFF
jgi:hypothetical protein